MSTIVVISNLKEILTLWDESLMKGEICCKYNGLYLQIDAQKGAIVNGKLPQILEEQFNKNRCCDALNPIDKYLFKNKQELASFLSKYDRHKNQYQQILKLWGTISSGVVVEGVNLQNYNGVHIHIDECGVVRVFGKLPDVLADKYKKNKHDSKLLSTDCYLFKNALELAEFLLSYDEYKDNLIIKQVISGDYSIPETPLKEGEKKQFSLFAELNSVYKNFYPGEDCETYINNADEKIDFIKWCKQRQKAFNNQDDIGLIGLIIQTFENKKRMTAKKNTIELLKLGERRKKIEFAESAVPINEDIEYDEPGFVAGSLAQLKSLESTVLPFLLFDASFGKGNDLGKSFSVFSAFLENTSIQVREPSSGVLEVIITMNGTGNKIVYTNAKGHISLTSTFDSEQERLTLCHFYDETSEDERVRGMGYFIECSNKETEYDKRFFARFTCNFNKHSVKVENLLNPNETQIIDYINVSDQERWAITQSFMIGKIVDIVERVNQLVITGNTKGTR